MADGSLENASEQTAISKRGTLGFVLSHLRRMSWQQTFAALKYRNYRLWFWGQMVSLFGTWMQSTAQGYLIFQLTHSTDYLGYVAFVGGLPSWLFMVYGGVIADRVSRRTLLTITQTAMMALAFILGALVFLHVVQPWHIVALAFALGVANAFDAPARQSFVLEMVDREDMVNAIALNATMFNSATAVGPAVGGAMYALFGPGWCFTLNGISFIAVIIALALMKIKPVVAPPRRQTSTLVELVEGARYVLSQRLIVALIGLVGTLGLFGMAFITLMPAWAVNILGGNETTNGLLQSARGAGALVSALMIASLGRFRFKGKLLTLGSLVFPSILIIFAWVRWLPLSLLLLFCLGMAQILVMNLANAMVQLLVPDELRGRVMGIYTFIFFGFMPIGGLLAGAVAGRIGEPITVTLGATISLCCAILIWIFVPKVRALE